MRSTRSRTTSPEATKKGRAVSEVGARVTKLYAMSRTILPALPYTAPQQLARAVLRLRQRGCGALLHAGAEPRLAHAGQQSGQRAGAGWWGEPARRSHT